MQPLPIFYKEGVEIEIAIEYANIAAAMSTTKKHVLNSLPELDEILKTKNLRRFYGIYKFENY